MTVIDEKFSGPLKEQVKKAEKNKILRVVIKTKQKEKGGKEAQMAYGLLQKEKLATRRAHLLGIIQERYGIGADFYKNYEDSRLKSQAKVVGAAPNAVNLWLTDSVAVSGTTKEIEDLAKHEDTLSIDINPTFEVPSVLETPLEDTPEAVDGSAWGVAKIHAPEVWGGFGRGEKVLVGHLDTGVDDTHPALRGQVESFEEFDDLGNPVGSATHDAGSHGTHTAGTICGRNYRGINIGVAPNAKLISALVLPSGGGSFAQIVAGMQWVVSKGAHVINMSLGGSGYSSLWNLPVLNATLSGALVVASIGNSGHGTSGGPGNDRFSLGVGATSYLDIVAGFSGGQTLKNVHHDKRGLLTYMKPDISAPGVQVLSSVPNDGIAALNGTSMAAPHIAGAAALLISANYRLAGEPFIIRNILMGTVEDYGEAGRDQRFGFGRIDTLSAAETAVSLAV